MCVDACVCTICISSNILAADIALKNVSYRVNVHMPISARAHAGTHLGTYTRHQKSGHTSSIIDMSSSSSIAFCSNFTVMAGAADFADPHPPLPPKPLGERSGRSCSTSNGPFLALMTVALEDIGRIWQQLLARAHIPVRLSV